MKKALTYVVFFDIVFIFFLAISVFFSGIMGRAVYYLAFVLPIFLAILLCKKMGLSVSVTKWKISGEGAILTLPLVAPTFALVFFISWLTSLVLSHFGAESVSDVQGNIILVIFTHAFLTAVCEELLFRYIPIAYLAPHSKRAAVLFSALFFALAHCNLFQIPYALAAGIIFAALDIAFDSILPSLFLHFGNNLISIIWLRGSGEIGFVKVYVLILVSVAALSFIPVFLMRKKYSSALSAAFEKSNVKEEIGYAPLILIVTTLIIALTSL